MCRNRCGRKPHPAIPQRKIPRHQNQKREVHRHPHHPKNHHRNDEKGANLNLLWNSHDTLDPQFSVTEFPWNIPVDTLHRLRSISGYHLTVKIELKKTKQPVLNRTGFFMYRPNLPTTFSKKIPQERTRMETFVPSSNPTLPSKVAEFETQKPLVLRSTVSFSKHSSQNPHPKSTPPRLPRSSDFQ